MDFVALVIMFILGAMYGVSTTDNHPVRQEPPAPTYTQRQAASYDFMRDNPTSMTEVCSKRFNPVMDSDRSVK